MPVLNVYDNVALPVTFDCGKHINRKYIEELLRELGIWEKRKKYPNELSGGQQQRVAIARALANKPSILLCDEPTGNLDSATTIEVMGLLKTSCRKYNQTILMVTHNEAIAQTCDRVIHIEDGQIVTGKRRFPAKAVMSYVKAGMEIYAVLQEPDICNFCEYFINSIIAFRDFFFDLQQSEK